jgi:hypothetical protein
MNRLSVLALAIYLSFASSQAFAVPLEESKKVAKVDAHSVVPQLAHWIVDNTTSIGGHVPTLVGAPKVKKTTLGKAVCFNGESDGLFFDVNPIAGMGTLTVEVLFQPALGGAAEQRFVHLEETSPASYRAMVETRLNSSDFYLDTFLKSPGGNKTLVNAKATHPLDTWYWAALVYDGTTMRHYVNGVEDASDTVAFSALGPGKSALGVRLNKVSWFKGCIREVLFTPKALGANELQKLPDPVKKRSKKR